MNNRENLKNKLLEHMITIYVPEFIQDEFWEQEAFYSIKYLQKMLTWTLCQFEDWYEQGGDYCMRHY